MNRQSILIGVVSLFLVGCANTSGVKLKDQNLPLKKLQSTVVNSFASGKRTGSRNGREFTSNYFMPPGQHFQKRADRYYVHVYILGDRRPYDIEVYAYGQKKVRGEWVNVTTDKGLAKTTLRRIQINLTQGREDINIIDDFRVF